MKKFFTLFAVALMGLGAASAQDTKCTLTLEPVAENQTPERVEINMIVDNQYDNLNGFNFEFDKPDAAEWVVMVPFPKSYVDYSEAGAFYLGKVEGITDEQRNQYLPQFADLKNNVKQNRLVVVTVLSTADCREMLVGKGIVGKFAIDMSKCEDGDEYIVKADATPEHQAYATVDAVSHTANAPTILRLQKKDGVVKEYTGINTVETSKNVTSVKYYNLQGVESATPFQGVNVMVQTYDDGSKATSKIVK